MTRLCILHILLVLTACPGAGVEGIRLDTLEVFPPEFISLEEDSYQVPENALCIPGVSQCIGNTIVKCRNDSLGWDVVQECKQDQACTPNGCVSKACQPGVPVCKDNRTVKWCLPDGSGFGENQPCKEDEICLGGLCVSSSCALGAKKCTPTSLIVCEGSPPSWKENPCAAGEICFKDKCIDCLTDEHCPEGMVCKDGRCTKKPLTITTETLPDGIVGQYYQAQLSGEGWIGQPSWFALGDLPSGLSLDSGSGTIAGIPEKDGAYPIKFRLKDSAGMETEKDLMIFIYNPQLQIKSKSPLPPGEDGVYYEFKFEAIGGEPPYGWMVIDGKLPEGLDLLYNGILKGTPEQSQGKHKFKVRVIDTGEQIASDTKEFELEIKIADLQIIGKQMIDVWIMKIVVLPVITIMEGIPIPYNAQLEAKGGLKPYAWTESKLDNALKLLIPKAGIPKGLTLGKDGKLSGNVTSTSEVVEVNVPFINIKLKGFFFVATVKDSQSPPDSDSAIFLIPTVPVTLPF